MKFIFSLGKVDKKLLLLVFYILSQISIIGLKSLLVKYEKDTIEALDDIASGLGTICTIFIPYVIKYRNKVKEKTCTKTNIKYISILIILNGFYYVTIYFDFEEHSPFSVFYSKVGFEIILISVITIIFLKYKYYIHHIISIILVCLFSVGVDLILNNYEKISQEEINILRTILDIVSIFMAVIIPCYQTYLMRNKYYQYWNLLLINGIINMSINIIICIIYYTYNTDDYQKDIVETDIGFSIFRFIFLFIFSGFFSNLLGILIIFYLSPNHYVAIYELRKIFSYLLLRSGVDNNILFPCLVLILFQIISLMFYLEIFEFNFCGLNKNTKKNIQIRENVEMSRKDSYRNSNASIEDYVIHYDEDENNLDRKKTIELTEEVGKEANKTSLI